jgi:2-polyprenyl-3-methyl-5-hydroxy-6-metoxy-1,4-benzoquinol methylase
MSAEPTPIELGPELVALALRDPLALRYRLGLERPDGSTDRSPRPRVVIPDPEIPVPHGLLWRSESDRVAVSVAGELSALTDLHDPRGAGSAATSLLGRHAPGSGKEARKKYLYQTALRVAQLCDALADHGLTSGSVLEIGSLYGSFALSLQRLGYDVTVIDRYDDMDPSVNGYVDKLEDAGIRVVRTTRAGETQAIESLGSYNCVIAMAVIEHVPHTPRHLLELMKRRASPGGLMAVDTPNVARYWNRRCLEEGQSIFQDIAVQYYCDMPFEGHHREYTVDEARWMLEQLGCRDVRVRLFDYNMLQFARIDRQHIDCLTAIVEDLRQADMILASGRLGRRFNAG